MPINANWKARFLLCLVGPVKVSGLQRSVANLSNRVFGGRYLFLMTKFYHLVSNFNSSGNRLFTYSNGGINETKQFE